MIVLTLLLGAIQAAADPAETVRSAIVAKCGIAAERLATIDPTSELPMPGIMVKGSAPLTDKQLSCYGGHFTDGVAYPQFEDDKLGARYERVIEQDNRRNARADMRRRGLLARLPRFDRRHERLSHFARRLEALCGAKPESVLDVRDAHIQLVEAKLTPDVEFSEADLCTISAAIASGHHPFYLPPVKYEVPSVSDPFPVH